MTTAIMPEPRQRYYNNDGTLAAGCLLYTYAAGTSTPKLTYTDSAGTVGNSNPIVLDAKGEALIYWNGAYKVDLKTAVGVQITGYPVDNYTSTNSYTDTVVNAWIANLAATSGAGLSGFSHANTYAQGTVGLHCLGFVNVKDAPYNAVGDGAANDTIALQAAINSKKPLFIPEGTYLTGALFFPNDSGGKHVVFLGAGEGLTIFQANATNITLLQKINTAGTCDAAQIGGFSIKAHAAGSTAPAIKCTGFRDSTFKNIEGLSNGAFGFYSLLDLAAHPWLCYKNTLNNIRMDSTQGWTKGIEFNSDGTGNAANNSNIATVGQPWFNQNIGMTCCVDATRSAKVTIKGGIFEQNAGATAVRSGNTSTIQDNWFELNGGDIQYQDLADGTSNDSLVIGNYFSTAHTISFLNTCLGNLWINNTEAGAQTFTGNSYNNTKIKVPGTNYNVAVPVIAYDIGQAGVLTLSAASIISAFNAISGDVVVSYVYTWTAGAAATNTRFTIPVPTGFTLKSWSASLTRAASGQPTTIAFDGPAQIWAYNAFNDAHTMYILTTYTRA